MLVTRVREEALRTADELARRGHEAIIAPLSEIRLLATEEPNLSDVQAILATSSNGVRAFARRCRRRDIRVAAVGENTAAAARAAGFSRVSSAAGDSAALATMVRNSLNPVAGALLHVAARSRGDELHRELAAAGFECRVWELYEIVASRTLPEHAIRAFNRGAVDAILVLSPESGRILDEALKSAGMIGRCDRVMAFCISESTAAAIRDIEFRAIRLAETPTLDAVLSLLDSGTRSGSTAQR